MIVQRNETKKTLFLLIITTILFLITMYFFIDFSQSIEKGIKRFFNNINFQYNYATYDKTLKTNKKLYLQKKEEELQKIELSNLKRDDYFEFKVDRFEKHEF